VDIESTSARHRETIQRLAEDSFEKHILEEECPGVFLCHNPKTILYSFRIAFLPAGLIVVYGDIGDMMLQRGGEGWLSQAIRHDYVSDYVMEKRLPRGKWNHQREFMPGDAALEITRLHAGVPRVQDGVDLVAEARQAGIEVTEDHWDQPPDPAQAERIAEDWLCYDESGHDSEAFGRAWAEHVDWEVPDFHDYSSNDLWCYEALKWFVRERAKKTES